MRDTRIPHGFGEIKVESSAFELLAWRAKTQELFVIFRGGDAYIYKKIGRHLMTQLLKAQSKGKYFNAKIRHKRSEKIESVAG